MATGEACMDIKTVKIFWGRTVQAVMSCCENEEAPLQTQKSTQRKPPRFLVLEVTAPSVAGHQESIPIPQHCFAAKSAPLSAVMQAERVCRVGRGALRRQMRSGRNGKSGSIRHSQGKVCTAVAGNTQRVPVTARKVMPDGIVRTDCIGQL